MVCLLVIMKGYIYAVIQADESAKIGFWRIFENNILKGKENTNESKNMSRGENRMAQSTLQTRFWGKNRVIDLSWLSIIDITERLFSPNPKLTKNIYLRSTMFKLFGKRRPSPSEVLEDILSNCFWKKLLNNHMQWLIWDCKRRNYTKRLE